MLIIPPLRFFILKFEKEMVKLAYVKKCPKCKGKSYSASKKKWKCPYCGADLKKVKAERAKN